MQKLADAIESQVDRSIYDDHILNKAAIEWATHSLRTYSGTLLKKAMDISTTLSEFVHELQDHVGEADND